MTDEPPPLNYTIPDPPSAPLRYFAAALLSLTCLLGLTGYTVMIYVIVKTTNIGGGTVYVTSGCGGGGGGRDGGSRVMLVNAYAAGLLGSVTAIPVYAANVAGGRLVIPVAMCKAFGFVNVVAFNALLATSVAIVIRQCLLLVTRDRGRYSDRTTWVIIALSWSVPMAIGCAVSPYVGFSPVILNCLLGDLRHETPRFVPVVVIATPTVAAVVTILISYALLFQASNIRQTVVVDTVATVTGEATRRARTRNIRLALKLTANWSIFAAFWLPMSCMLIADIIHPVPSQTWLVGSVLARMFYGTGWMLFGIWNERLRQTLRRLVFRRCYDKRATIVPALVKL